MLVVATALFLGCTSTTVTGEVTNAQSGPVGAVDIIANIGDDCRTQTDSSGSFQLECAPGDWELTASHPGFLHERRRITVASGTHERIEPIQLLRIPTRDGLHVLRDGAFVPLEKATLRRSTAVAGNAKTRDFCITPDQSPTATLTASGDVTMLSNGPIDWRPFRMDADGCAYRDEKTAEGQWVINHQDRPAVRGVPEHTNAIVSRWPAKTGDYFIAEWSGFFVPTAPKSQTYSGWWLRID